MELSDALAFTAPRRNGVLATIKADGRPQLSNILCLPGQGDTVRISVTDDRAKVKNLRRDPRASLYVVGDSHWQYVVLEGTTTLTPVAGHPSDAVVEELVEMYRGAGGEHPDWDEYRQAMVDDRRLVVHFTPGRAYGMVPGD